MVRQSGPAMKDILGLKDKALDSTQSIDSFTFDKEIYTDVYDMSRPIQQTVSEGDSVIKTFPDLAQDIFMSLYKHKPKLLDDEDVKTTHQFNHKIMDELMQMEEYRKLRSKTRLDMVSSAMGFEVLGNEAVQVLRKYEAEMQAAKQNPDENTLIDDINQQMQGENTGAPGSGGGGGMPGKGKGKGKPGAGGSGGGGQGMTQGASKQQANQQAQGQGAPDPNGQGQSNNQQPLSQQAMQDLLDRMREDLQGAAKKALDDVSEMRDFLQAWGMDGGDPNNRITYEDKKRALQRLRGSDKIKQLTQMVGRMKKLAINEQKQKAPEGAEAIKSVKTGDNITAILPSEKAMLASSNKSLRRNFYRKFYQKELLEYDMDVYESMGRGPMIVEVDVSGSMHGEREQWSKAVALALLEVANKQKRNFACVHFDHQIENVWEIPHGQLKPDDVFDIAELFSGGGTNFELPLRRAMQMMDNSKFKKGDVVFITDGDCMISDAFLAEFKKLKKEKEFNVYTVLIDVGGGGGRGGIAEFSDKIIPLSNLAKMGEAAASEIFRNV